ncbi:MAG: hypothetical protein LBC59_08885 [Chitinispirillales bacterium]|jgi:uncharacterized protein (TIGR02145 family)|nr:hypothetical protein [Chitinispirillales bacterium]
MRKLGHVGRIGRAVLLVALLAGMSAAQVKRVFVANVGISSGASAKLTPEEIALVTKSIRREAVENLPSPKYEVMTSETVIAQGSAVLEKCDSDECVISLGSTIGADYIVRGTISKIRTMFALSVEMHETENGNLVASSELVRSENIVELLDKTAAACAKMFKTFADRQGSAAQITQPKPKPEPEPPKQPATYKITTYVIPVGGGIVSRYPNQTYYEHGTVVSVTAVPEAGYTFSGWSGASSSKNANLTAPIDRDLILTAIFDRRSASTQTYQPPAQTYQPPAQTYQPPVQTPTYQRSTVDGSGVLTDGRDGKRYNTAVIGGKRWMAKNLNYQPQTGQSWCYNNDNSKCNEYGRLYDWNTAKTVCMPGWHLPSRQEWDNLVKTAGGDKKAGKMLKAKSGWNGKKGNGTDNFGFSALPGGYRLYSNGIFDYAGYGGYWWTATENGSYAYLRDMNYNYDSVYEYYYSKSYGFSARCVADNER